MAAWRYEISLLVLKKTFTSERSGRVRYFSNTRREIYEIYINTNETPNHFTLIVFWWERRDLLETFSIKQTANCKPQFAVTRLQFRVA